MGYLEGVIKEVGGIRRRKGMNRKEGGAEEERKGREREKRETDLRQKMSGTPVYS